MSLTSPNEAKTVAFGSFGCLFQRRQPRDVDDARAFRVHEEGVLQWLKETAEEDSSCAIILSTKAIHRVVWLSGVSCSLASDGGVLVAHFPFPNSLLGTLPSFRGTQAKNVWEAAVI